MSKKVSRNAELLLYTLMRVGRRRPALLEARGGYDEHESSDEDKRLRRLGDTLPTACRRALTSVAQHRDRTALHLDLRDPPTEPTGPAVWAARVAPHGSNGARRQ